MISAPDPQARPWRWYKGNLHAHTDRSDGKLPPPAVADWYARAGYDFLAITDHRMLTRLRSPYNGMLLVPGAEVTACDEATGAVYHLVGLFDADDGGLVSSMGVRHPQDAVDALAGAGGAVIVAHPYWLGLSAAETGALNGPVAVEVYNHHCELGRGRGYCGQQWDELLLARRRLSGVAVDDCHFRTMDAGGGWIMLKARELSPASVLGALRRGDFYSTQGPEITRYEIVDGAGGPAALVECSPCRKVVFYADRWLGGVAGAEVGAGTPLLTGARYPLTGKETYVRAVCVADAGQKAWTNPLFPERGRETQ